MNSYVFDFELDRVHRCLVNGCAAVGRVAVVGSGLAWTAGEPEVGVVAK